MSLRAVQSYLQHVRTRSGKAGSAGLHGSIEAQQHQMPLIIRRAISVIQSFSG